MKAVIQRVTNAEVVVNGESVGKIGKGFFVLLGVSGDDTRADAEILAAKTANLRVFEDENEKMNLSVLDIGGEILAVSQFTLIADTKKGNRPSFIGAMKPDAANELYEYYKQKLLENGVKSVESGIFGADMKCEIHNDGPVTIILDTLIWRK